MANLDIVGRGGQLLTPVPPSVTIHEYVPDVSTIYSASDVFVVPLFAGSGVRLKILDALKYGIPVVSTTVGYSGLDLQPGRDFLLADDAESFASCISDVLSSRPAHDRLAQAGKEFLLANHSSQAALNAARLLATRLAV